MDVRPMRPDELETVIELWHETCADTYTFIELERGRTLEERLIRLALQRTAGNRSQAARALELSPRALQYKIKEYAIDPLNPLSAQADSSE